MHTVSYQSSHKMTPLLVPEQLTLIGIAIIGVATA
jgi:hypothetical protein